MIRDQLLLTISTTRKVLASLLLMEEALFTWAFRRRFSLFKYLQEFNVAYQERQPERLIFDYTLIILVCWKSRDQSFELEYPWNQEGCSPETKT